ncbi:hypothetical protein Godav_020620 [Gossypium davidsonii]|uniref:DUF4283 domain-containing protein n=1 Tax=Gossypium davidsonii TaxID=34287 RepID=A0A7J8R3P1_GOSDV|nr:hypothetical protein [Gossypium davidsonii]
MVMEEEMAGLNIDDGKEEVLSLRIDVGSQTVTYEGVQISDLRERRYLFKFYHEIDIERVINGTPWTFNNLLFVYRVGRNEDPM